MGKGFWHSAVGLFEFEAPEHVYKLVEGMVDPFHRYQAYRSHKFIMPS